MPLEKGPEQPESPQEIIEKNQETAKNALDMAGFEVGQTVSIPLQDGQCQIIGATALSVGGREIPGVTLQNISTGSYISTTLEGLCNVNPTEIFQSYYESPPQISIKIKSEEIIYLRKIEGEEETKELFGRIENRPIEVGKIIESTIQPNTPPVASISTDEDKYIIQTEDGQTYIFDPLDSFDARHDGPETTSIEDSA